MADATNTSTAATAFFSADTVDADTSIQDFICAGADFKSAFRWGAFGCYTLQLFVLIGAVWSNQFAGLRVRYVGDLLAVTFFCSMTFYSFFANPKCTAPEMLLSISGNLGACLLCFVFGWVAVDRCYLPTIRKLYMDRQK